MRKVLFTFLVTLGCAGAHAESPKARTDLLSYDEVMQLTPQKRIRYFADLSLLLAIMEQKTEAKYDLVAIEDIRRQRREVAWWLELFRSTEADAQGVASETVGEGAAAETKPSPAPKKNIFSLMGESAYESYLQQIESVKKVLADPEAAKAAFAKAQAEKAAAKNKDEAAKADPSSTGATTGGASGASAGGTTEPAPASTASGAKAYVDPPPRPKQVPFTSPGKVGLTDTPPSWDSAGQNANDVIDKCPIYPPECKPMSTEKRKQLILDFRKGEKYNTCIAGGFFSSKVANRRAGSCEFKTEYPFGNNNKFSCDDGRTALCNPMLFCLRYDNLPYKTVGKGGSDTSVKQLPIGICVPRGPNVTRQCFDRYNATLGLGVPQKRWDLIELKKQAKKNPRLKGNIARLEKDKVAPVACDFNNTTTPGLKEKYEELKSKTQEGYRELCELRPEDKAKFAQLFCEECGIISKQLHATLARAGQDCQKTLTPIPHNGGTGPGSNGGTGSAH